MKFYHKYIKQLLAVMLLLCVAGVSVSYTYATENAVGSTDVSALESQRQETLEEIESLKNSISDVKEEIDSLKTEKNTIQKYINQLDKKFDNLTAEIAEFEKKIEEKNIIPKKEPPLLGSSFFMVSFSLLSRRPRRTEPRFPGRYGFR